MSSKVTIYKHSRYRGDKKELGIGRYNVGSLGIGNDELSSLKVPTGLKVSLFKDKDFHGSKMICTRDTSYVGDNVNDETSSVIVEHDESPNVIFYLDAGFRGWSKELGLG